MTISRTGEQPTGRFRDGVSLRPGRLEIDEDQSTDRACFCATISSSLPPVRVRSRFQGSVISRAFASRTSSMWSRCRSSWQLGEDGADGLFQRRQVVVYRAPDSFEVDAEVLVNDDVAHVGNALPGNPGMGRDESGREVVGSLADHLEVVDDSRPGGARRPSTPRSSPGGAPGSYRSPRWMSPSRSGSGLTAAPLPKSRSRGSDL